MAKLARTEANGANTQHLTGPKSEEGKTRSAVNSLRRCRDSSRRIKPGEFQDQFEYFEKDLVQQVAHHCGLAQPATCEASPMPLRNSLSYRIKGGKTELGSFRRRARWALMGRMPAGRIDGAGGNWVRLAEASASSGRADVRAGRIKEPGGNWVLLADAAAGSRRVAVPTEESRDPEEIGFFWPTPLPAPDGWPSRRKNQALRGGLGSSRRRHCRLRRAEVPPGESRRPEGIGFVSQRLLLGTEVRTSRRKNQAVRRELGSSRRPLPAPEGWTSRRKNRRTRRDLGSSRRRRRWLRNGASLAGRIRQSGGNWVRLAEAAVGSGRIKEPGGELGSSRRHRRWRDAQTHWVRLAPPNYLALHSSQAQIRRKWSNE